MSDTESYKHNFEGISRFSEAGKDDFNRPPPPPKATKSGVVDYSNIPAAAFKEGSVFNSTIANKFDPARDSVKEAVAGGGKKKKSSLKGSSSATPTTSKKGEVTPEEKERVELIKKHNKYARNQVIVDHLIAKGYQIGLLHSGASLEEAKAAMDMIDETLSAGAAKGLVIGALDRLNAMTETFVPELAENFPGDISLRGVFINQAQNPKTDIALSIEELSIAVEPYSPIGGYISRFIKSYSMMCLQLYTVKQQQKKGAYEIDPTQSQVGDDDVMPEEVEP
jgi:hypothetical protein